MPPPRVLRALLLGAVCSFQPAHLLADAPTLESLRLRVVVGEKYGYIDGTGRMVITPTWDWADDFAEGAAVVAAGGERPDPSWHTRPVHAKYSLIDASGAVTTRELFDDLGSLSEGLARAKRGGKWGFVDVRGNVAIEFRWDDAGEMHEGKARVQVGKRWGFIDRAGKQVGPADFEELNDFQAERARVKRAGKWGLLRPDGTLAGQAIYEELGPGVNDRWQAKRGGLYGYLDREGREVIPLQFEFAHDFSEGLAAVRKKAGSVGYIDPAGAFKIAPTLVFGGPFSEGLAAVTFAGPPGQLSSSYEGLINRQGQLVQKTSHEVFRVVHGRASIVTGGFCARGAGLVDRRWGAIDLQGNIIVPPVYCSPVEFSAVGIARAKLSKHIGLDYCAYLDRTGRTIWPSEPKHARLLGAYEGWDGFALTAEATGKWTVGVGQSGESLLFDNAKHSPHARWPKTGSRLGFPGMISAAPPIVAFPKRDAVTLKNVETGETTSSIPCRADYILPLPERGELLLANPTSLTWWGLDARAVAAEVRIEGITRPPCATADGSLVAWINRGQIFAARKNSKPALLSPATDWKAIALAPDGKTLFAVGGLEGRIERCDLATRKWSPLRPRAEHPLDHVAATAVAISHNGRWLAVGEERYPRRGLLARTFEIALWDLTTGQRVDTLTGPLFTVTMLSFAGSDVLVSGGDDQTLRWWTVGPAAPAK